MGRGERAAKLGLASAVFALFALPLACESGSEGSPATLVDAGPTADTTPVDSGARDASPDADETRDASDDAGQVCTRTHGRVGIRLGPYEAHTFDCAGVTSPSPSSDFVAFEGRLAELEPFEDAGAAGLTLKIEGCPAGDDACSPAPLDIVIDQSKALPWSSVLPGVGAFVRVEYHRAIEFGCSQSLTVRNLAVWNGAPNPVAPNAGLLFVLSDGFEPPDSAHVADGVDAAGAETNSEFQLEKKLACKDSAHPGCGGATPGDYTLAIRSSSSASDAGDAGAPITVAMGERQSVTLGTTNFQFDNLRSFQTPACDDYHNWAFQLFRAP